MGTLADLQPAMAAASIADTVASQGAGTGGKSLSRIAVNCSCMVAGPSIDGFDVVLDAAVLCNHDCLAP